MRGVALLLAVLVLAPATAGCLVSRIPELFSGEDGAGGKAGGGKPPAPAGRLRVQNVTWAENDTWVWKGSNGVRITDKVVEVRTIQRVIAGQVRNVTRYDVLTKEEWGRDLLPLWANHTYEPALGVVNSSAYGENVTYATSSGVEFRSPPLTYVGSEVYNVTANVSRFGSSETFPRTYNISRLGLRIAQTPAGDFQTWHVRINVTTGYTATLQPLTSTYERWFNETIGNDVKFSRGGVDYELIAYRVAADPRPLALGTLDAAPPGWRAGWSWRYEAPGATLTRVVMPCLPGDSAPIHKLCRLQYVHERGTDYYEVRTILSQRTGPSSITTREITLVPVARLAPHATGYYQTSSATVWKVDVNYTGRPPTYPPAAGDYVYDVRGRLQGYLPVNHTAFAKVTVESARTTTPLGTFDGVRVVTNTTFSPKNPYDGAGAWTEESRRVWSNLVRNDARFTLQAGNSQLEFQLVGVRFGEASKVEREL